MKPLLDNLSQVIQEALKDGEITSDEKKKIDSLADIIAENSKEFYKALEDAGFGLEALKDITDSVTESLRNVPDGFKRALTTFSSATGVLPSASYATGTAGMSSNAGISSMSSNNPNSESVRPIVINFNDVVYGTDDFEDKIIQITSKHNLSNQLSKTGTRGGK